MKTLPLGSGAPGFSKLRRRLEGQPLAPDVGAEALPSCEEARRFWSERAWSEAAAVPAISQLSLAMMRERFELDVLGALTRIASDEVRHTELSRDLANGLGGYTEDIPPEVPYEPARLAEIEACGAASWVLSIAVSETVSAALMQARLRYTTHPAVRDTLQRIYDDEKAHAATAWLICQNLVPLVAQSERDALAEQALEIFEAIGQTFITAGLPTLERAQARRVRKVTAERGLGAMPPDEADQLVMRVVTQTVAPRLRRAQIPVQI
ncbi:MAG: ferritin-like domain-containing protein [Deltaproteobacteria bacterium]|jgi:hypothetical protein